MILVKFTDKRYWRFLWQNITRGYNDSETWDLCSVTIEFVLPRLKRFRELNIAYPMGMKAEKFDEYLDEMIWAMEYRIRCNDLDEDRDTMVKNGERMMKGFELFGKYLNALWW